MTKHPEYPFRVFMPDGKIHLLRRIGPSQVCAEYPDFVRLERADRKQPPALIESETDG